MTTFLSIDQVLELHRLVIEQSGGGAGTRDRGALDSAVAQPHMSFGGTELYPNVAEKAATIGFSIVCNHPFIDGNKRVGHAALETFLVLNGLELTVTVDVQEACILQLASGNMIRQEFTDWVVAHVVKLV